VNDVPNFLAFLFGAACLVWAAAAISRRIDRHYSRRAGGDRTGLET
jgi:hypothetical protein